MDELDSNQRDCVDFNDGIGLVVATAGAGKTRVIIERCKRLVNSGIDKESILCITFSNKAADEISFRLKDYTGWVGTFHGTSFKLLRMYGILPSNTTILDEYDKKDVFVHLDIVNSLEAITKSETSEREIFDPVILSHYKIYREYCREKGFIDFQQIIDIMVSTLKENEEFRMAVTNRFRYIMVDEFQDSNRKQLELLRLIHKNNLMCIGDDDQAIYAWRGACVDNVICFSELWPNARIFYLNRNYRSPKSIVESAGAVVARISKRLPKSAFTERTGDKIQVFASKDEYGLIARIISQKQQNRTVAILLRSMSQMTQLENAFLHHGVQYQTLMGSNFLDRAEIRDVLAYLRCIFLNDPVHLKRMLSHPKRGLGPKKVEAIIEIMNTGVSLYEALMQGLSTRKYFEFTECIRSWREESSPFTAIERIWNESGLSEMHEGKDIEPLIRKARSFTTMEDFLQNLIDFDMEDLKSVVIVTTIHRAKGLEFDDVYIPGAFEGNIPHANAIMTKNIDDERRVFAVAMTRAKQSLVITYNPSDSCRDYFGMCRFLLNFPREHVVFTTD